MKIKKLCLKLLVIATVGGYFCYMISLFINAVTTCKESVSTMDPVSEISTSLKDLKTTLSQCKPPLEQGQRMYYEFLEKYEKTNNHNLDHALKNFETYFTNIYFDEVLASGNLIFGRTEDYWIYIKTHRKFFDLRSMKFKRKLNYKISSYPPTPFLQELHGQYGRIQSPICNAAISLIDEGGYEIFRIQAGSLTDQRAARGSFELAENEYKRIASIQYAN